MLRSRILPPPAGVSPGALELGLEVLRQPRLIVCWDRCAREVPARRIDREREGRVDGGSRRIGVMMSGEIAWRMRAIGPIPGGTEEVGLRPALNWSRLPCRRNCPLVNDFGS